MKSPFLWLLKTAYTVPASCCEARTMFTYVRSGMPGNSSYRVHSPPASCVMWIS
ncbi:MAG: hypothetical protein GWM90_12605, partial [Gemmatimonadetes bacterium]|nr:hypothetical protein [Gemmatimonadota bacterium]NIQ54892.1 hypothetical protein [Gemmatimonadota bacterium]NIU75090.1 hypothetical protein [Gammaproteobacteria bacterium]NIX44924.1 hypothetical protein [Gemmatimonadota bacterium]